MEFSRMTLRHRDTPMDKKTILRQLMAARNNNKQIPVDPVYFQSSTDPGNKSYKDAMKGYLERKERGELPSQKIDFLKQSIMKPVDLAIMSDGMLQFGDVVMLVNLGDQTQGCSALSVNPDINGFSQAPSPCVRAPCGLSAGSHVVPCVRTAFIITSVDGSPTGSTLHYEQSFALQTTSGFASELYLTSDLRSFQKCAKKSRLQEVNLEERSSFLSWWKIVHFDPQERLAHEGQPVPANERLVIMHCRTNQALAVLHDQILWTTFGKEYEVTAHTFLDSHKAEEERNHWILCTADPAGGGLLYITRQTDDATLTQADKEI